jgi:type IV fimbrial biogenesis protein FimT
MNGTIVNAPGQRASRRFAALQRPGAAGFTVTELMITVAMAAILATVAVPSFQTLIASQRAKTSSSELFSSLFNARSNAIMRNANVTISQNAGGWSNGWQTLDANNNVLDNHDAVAGVTIIGPATVTYSPSGRLPAGNAAPMFVITTHSGGTTVYQCVAIDLGGRPYTQQGSTC